MDQASKRSWNPKDKTRTCWCHVWYCMYITMNHTGDSIEQCRTGSVHRTEQESLKETLERADCDGGSRFRRQVERWTSSWIWHWSVRSLFLKWAETVNSLTQTQSERCNVLSDRFWRQSCIHIQMRQGVVIESSTTSAMSVETRVCRVMTFMLVQQHLPRFLWPSMGWHWKQHSGAHAWAFEHKVQIADCSFGGN